MKGADVLQLATMLPGCRLSSGVVRRAPFSTPFLSGFVPYLYMFFSASCG